MLFNTFYDQGNEIRGLDALADASGTPVTPADRVGRRAASAAAGHAQSRDELSRRRHVGLAERQRLRGRCPTTRRSRSTPSASRASAWSAGGPFGTGRRRRRVDAVRRSAERPPDLRRDSGQRNGEGHRRRAAVLQHEEPVELRRGSRTHPVSHRRRVLPRYALDVAGRAVAALLGQSVDATHLHRQAHVFTQYPFSTTQATRDLGERHAPRRSTRRYSRRSLRRQQIVDET